MNFFSILVSKYDDFYDRAPKNINLAAWLNGIDDIRPLVEAIRKEPDKDKRNALKKRLPAITPSGIFDGRGEDHLIQHSGLICLDFDGVDAERAKSLASVLPYVAFAGVSASGGGIYCLIPLKRPERHKNHFEALKKDMAAIGLNVDPICANVSHLRFYSFDDNPYLNPEAVAYDKEAAPKKKLNVDMNIPKRNDMEVAPDPVIIRLLAKIHKRKVDITATYADWLAVGGVLASMYGEGGRGLYHQFSWYHPEYKESRCDGQYDKCLAYASGFGVGLLMNVCKKYGVLLMANGDGNPPSSVSGGHRRRLNLIGEGRVNN